MTRLVYGLARTGSTSVSTALQMLGLKVFHYCTITSDHKQLEEFVGYDVVVTNDPSVVTLDWDRVLILTRDWCDLVESVERTLVNKGKTSYTYPEEALKEFVFSRIIQGKHLDTINIFKGERLWECLQGFTGTKGDTTRPFPHENYSDYQI